MNRATINQIRDRITKSRIELKTATAEALPIGTRVRVLFARNSIVEGVVLMSGYYEDEVKIQNEKTGKKRQFRASWNAWEVLR